METLTRLSETVQEELNEELEQKADYSELAEHAVTTPTENYLFDVQGTFLVKEIHPDYKEFISAEVVGRLVRARRSDNQPDYWFAGSNYAGDLYYRSFRFTGSLVNPTPEVGKAYREVAGDRRLLTLREGETMFTVLAGPAGEPWPIPDDKLAFEGASAYVEVTYEGPLTPVVVDPSSLEWMAPSTEFPLYGYAKVEEGVEGTDTVLVNPKPKDGSFYIVWSRGARSNSYVALKQWGQEELRIIGRLRGTGSINTGYSGGLGDYFTETSRLRWVELNQDLLSSAGPAEDSATVFDTKIQRLEKQLADSREKFVALNDALSELADEQGWCSEYEGVMSRLNMEGRPVRYFHDVRVSLTITQTEEGAANTTLGRVLENSIGFGGAVRNLTYSTEYVIRLYTRGKNKEMAISRLTKEEVEKGIKNRVSQYTEKNILTVDWNGEFEVTNSMREDGTPEPTA